MNKKIRKSAGRAMSLLLAAALALAAWEMPVSAGEENPANPTHHCTKLDDGSDRTDWSYVYFGSYPQTEIPASQMTKEIAEAFYDVNGDAWINGTKYRRISKGDTNYDAYFGRSVFRYFKWEPIKWRVLENNGSELFLMADKGLDCKKVNIDSCPITWKDCSLRRWLNREFYQEAFSAGEQGAVVETSIETAANSDSDERDNVSLLCYLEAINSKYGFCANGNTLSASRWMQPSNYARAMGTLIDEDGDMAGNCHWWLRHPGDNPRQYAITGLDGSADWRGGNLFVRHVAVVPVLHIKLSSGLWSSSYNETGTGTGAGTGSPGGNGAGTGGSSTGGTGTSSGTGNAGNGTGNVSASTAKPSATSISGKVKAKSKSFVVKWKKQKSVSGYQIQYSTNKKFTKKTTKMKTVKKASATSLTVKKLKAKKTYYVRVRTYKTVKGKQIVSKWSKAARVKTKK